LVGRHATTDNFESSDTSPIAGQGGVIPYGKKMRILPSRCEEKMGGRDFCAQGGNKTDFLGNLLNNRQYANGNHQAATSQTAVGLQAYPVPIIRRGRVNTSSSSTSINPAMSKFAFLRFRHHFATNAFLVGAPKSGPPPKTSPANEAAASASSLFTRLTSVWKDRPVHRALSVDAGSLPTAILNDKRNDACLYGYGAQKERALLHYWVFKKVHRLKR